MCISCVRSGLRYSAPILVQLNSVKKAGFHSGIVQRQRLLFCAQKILVSGNGESQNPTPFYGDFDAAVFSFQSSLTIQTKHPSLQENFRKQLRSLLATTAQLSLQVGVLVSSTGKTICHQPDRSVLQLLGQELTAATPLETESSLAWRSTEPWLYFSPQH